MSINNIMYMIFNKITYDWPIIINQIKDLIGNSHSQIWH